MNYGLVAGGHTGGRMNHRKQDQWGRGRDGIRARIGARALGMTAQVDGRVGRAMGQRMGEL